MKLKKHHIEAILAAGLVKNSGQLPAEALYDEAFDAWQDLSPEVRAWTAEQDKGEYPIAIRGVPGAYFVQAQEHDDSGPFDTVEEAEHKVKSNFGEFLIDD